jgi:acyl-CoA reductase-like NAD-dependent aldehyde dehydrogenase
LFGNKKTFEQAVDDLYQQYVDGGATMPAEQLNALQALVKKPSAPTDIWTGRYVVDRRENWEQYLEFLKVPEANWEIAKKAPDFHEYYVTEDKFFMDHRIPAHGLHLRIDAFLDNEWCESPYKRATPTLFQDGPKPAGAGQWKHRWVVYPTSWETTIPDFSGTGATMHMVRELQGEILKFTCKMLDPESGAVLVGPSYAFFKRVSSEPPMMHAAELKAAVAAREKAPSLEGRLELLDTLGKMIEENVDALTEAQEQDGLRPANFMGSWMMMKGALGFYKGNLAKWMAPTTVADTAPFGPEGKWEVVPEPKGVGLVISPSNAPVLLCVLPLMGMLAAGNHVVLKPSDQTPRSSRVLARLVVKYFPRREVVVVEGGKEVIESLIATPVDHIVFTGGCKVARAVASLAAKQLTPISLELGGKNPCFVDACASDDLLRTYVAEIVMVKHFFGGQFCQAHDYCLVHEDTFARFLELLEEALKEKELIPLPAPALARYERLAAGLEHLAVPKTAQLSAKGGSVPLVALVEPPQTAAVMQEEVFAPLLPIFKVRDAAAAAVFVRQFPKPLVAYCYSPNVESVDIFVQCTSSGNLAVNAGPMRMQSNFNIGFGGVGHSGYGFSIWGKSAFDDYSHMKPVFQTSSFAASSFGGKGKGKGK